MSLPSDNPVLDVRGLTFPADGSLLCEVGFAVGEGETVAFLGPAGSGKSALLACLSGTVHPAAGAVWANGTPFHLLSADQKRAFRLRHFGLVHQETMFLPELTVAQNVALPLVFAGVGLAEATERAHTWLARFEIAEHAAARPNELSCAPARRAALARAMVNDPLVLFADEPFADLTVDAARSTARIMRSIAASHATAVVVFTRHRSSAEQCRRTVHLVAGRTSAEPLGAWSARAALPDRLPEAAGPVGPG